MALRDLLEASAADPLACSLARVLAHPAVANRAGRPYLTQPAWELLRDGVPHLLGFGPRVLACLDGLDRAAAAGSARLTGEEQQSLRDASSVVRQVVLTAAITAPPDLWLLRHVLGYFSELGLLERLASGEALHPSSCTAAWRETAVRLDEAELETDLLFLLSRGMVEPYDQGYRIAGHPRVRAAFARATPRPAHVPASTARLWRRLFEDDALSSAEIALLLEAGQEVPARVDPAQNHWIPDADEIELGHRLVGVVLGLRASGRTGDLPAGAAVAPSAWSGRHPACAAAALEVLTAAGWMRPAGAAYAVTAVGARGFARGPGPFGIIETYHPYMERGRDILLHGRGDVHVQRGENVGASQDANRASFLQANDALDRFCRDTGFSYRVFIEHAIGRGEATRQRYERAGDALTYVGADLEDAAIDAAAREQAAGRLPARMVLVRSADIGEPAALLDALRRGGVEARSAVMLVGNGFHEVRGQTDEKMVDVFRGYERAGIVLLFTEESALSIDDLRATAWNTYHAGFKYVHEKSGQGLRPADPNPRPARLGRPLRAAWSECARTAGYVRADAYCTRTRTVYPCTPPGGHNPSISSNQFFVPGELARSLSIARR